MTTTTWTFAPAGVLGQGIADVRPYPGVVVCDGRRGTADRWSGRGPQRKRKAADPGFGFRGLEEDR